MEERENGSGRKAIRQQRQLEKAKHVSAFLFVFLCAVIAVAFLPGLRSALAGDSSVLKKTLIIVQKPRLDLEYPVWELPESAADEVKAEGTSEAELAGYLASANTYKSENVAIEIDKVSKGGNTYFVAHVHLKDVGLLKTGTYTNELGKVVKKDVVTMADQNNAVLAINTDFYTYRNSGIIIRNGKVILNDGWGEALCVYADGSMAVVNGLKSDAYDLAEQGVVNSFNFGPALILDSEIAEANISGSIIKDTKNPRTGIGYYGPGEYLFICVDGRKEGYSNGMTIKEFAELFKEYGVEMAYNLDGGGSTTMAFMGNRVNLPQGLDTYMRSVDGILLVADSVYP